MFIQHLARRLEQPEPDKIADSLADSVEVMRMWRFFAHVHQTLRVTPAMEAGVSDHVWSTEDIVNLLP
jgi:hypothetical protein